MNKIVFAGQIHFNQGTIYGAYVVVAIYLTVASRDPCIAERGRARVTHALWGIKKKALKQGVKPFPTMVTCVTPPYIVSYGVTHVIIVACLRMHICIFVLNLVSMNFVTSIPITFNISMEMLLLFNCTWTEYMYCKLIHDSIWDLVS